MWGRHPVELEGVTVDIVCGNVPVVSLEKDSCFNEYVSTMLQAACDSTAKADALYEHCDDQEVTSACRRIDLTKDCISVVRLRHNTKQSLMAVGASGKRSSMMACVVALTINDPDGQEDLWEMLRSYRLHRSYDSLWEMLKASGKLSRPRNNKDARKKVSKRDDRNQYQYSADDYDWGDDYEDPKDQAWDRADWKQSKATGNSRRSSRSMYSPASCYGVNVTFVCDTVPVVDMDRESVFNEHAALMVQSACESSSRADALYLEFSDKEILAECRQQGLKKDHVNVVKMRQDDLQSVRAVGTSGKRSTMLACCIAMSLNDPDGLEDLWTMLREYKLHRYYWELLEEIQGSGQGSGQDYHTNSSDSKWTGKRKPADDGRWASKSSWSSDSRRRVARDVTSLDQSNVSMEHNGDGTKNRYDTYALPENADTPKFYHNHRGFLLSVKRAGSRNFSDRGHGTSGYPGEKKRNEKSAVSKDDLDSQLDEYMKG